MADSLDNVNEVLAAIDKEAIQTSQGSFIRVDEVRRLLEVQKQAKVEEKAKPRPKTFDQAKRMAKADPEISKHFEQGIQEPGRSVTAQP